MRSITDNSKGFTLVELLVVIALSGLVIGSIYGVYQGSLHSQSVQDDVVGIQQEQRFSLDFLTQNLRMAGYDPTESAGASIVAATSTYIYYTLDWKGAAVASNATGEADGALDDPEEHIAFCLYNGGGNGQTLGYTSGSVPDTGHTAGNVHNHQPVISNVENLEFYYRMADGTSTLAPAVMDDIRGVTISLLVRADAADPKFSAQGATFTAASGAVWGPFNDNIRRRIVQTNVDFRNMGL